ncbi:hypothetical protein GCM10010095_75620 [Streptomyces anthocyanicus]|uniref:hypothetical protein n=1 Tax=Streptomyces anthocyanicus TaxID=68174 RepID=UPI00199B3C62|nr:hypothetical protein [Streptomyces anthocyanicus]GGL79456.1 hypothetical protein GCM10010095_75620 [Streptomyces anthocyanicus]
MKNSAGRQDASSAVSRRQLVKYAGVGATFVAASPLAVAAPAAAAAGEERGRGGGSHRRAWRAGDHHVHSEYSGEFDTSTTPPTFHKGADAVYPIVTNAIMAKHFGLSWAMCAPTTAAPHTRR